MCCGMQNLKTQYHVRPISQAYGIDFPELFDVYMVKFWHDKTVVPLRLTQLTSHIKFRFKKISLESTFPKD
jgi:hypothetical protein